jgi:hypothetical protein
MNSIYHAKLIENKSWFPDSVKPNFTPSFPSHPLTRCSTIIYYSLIMFVMQNLFKTSPKSQTLLN